MLKGEKTLKIQLLFSSPSLALLSLSINISTLSLRFSPTHESISRHDQECLLHDLKYTCVVEILDAPGPT